VDLALSGSYGLTVSADVKLHIAETLKNASARVAGFYIFDGGEVSTRLTSNDPIELVNQLFKAMDEWTATVRQSPKAYTVTLAPYAIALGPPPPNMADFEHQRDVLIRCAKLRSQTLDKLNLIDYMLDPDHTAEFTIVAPPDGPDLAALLAALAGDLDVIADAASFALDNAKTACDPETFMRQIKHVAGFTLTPLPSNLPAHTGPPPSPSPVAPSGTFTIPNWQTMDEVNAAGQNPDLNIVVLSQTDNTRPTGTIISIVPSPGTTISLSAEITVTTTRNLITDPIPVG
jgi:hypothetical protein